MISSYADHSQQLIRSDTSSQTLIVGLRSLHGNYPVHGEVYSIHHYVIKFASDLRQVGGFLQVLRFPPPIKLPKILCLESQHMIMHDFPHILRNNDFFIVNLRFFRLNIYYYNSVDFLVISGHLKVKA